MADSNWKCVHYNELPPWMQHNSFLRTSYRPELGSVKLCFKSLFRLHADTGNIWTHLVPAVIYLVLIIHMVVCDPHTFLFVEKFFNLLYYISCFLVFFLSSLFHTLSCHSQRVCEILSRADYFGIALMICGSMVSYLYYAFYESQRQKWFYISLIILFCLISVIVSMYDAFNDPDQRWLRSGLFIIYGVTGVFPTLHLLVCRDASIRETNFLFYMIEMALFYLTGAVLYTLRIPERFSPGRFDYWFSSHQIFHIFVIFGSVTHNYSIMTLIHYRVKTVCDCGIYKGLN